MSNIANSELAFAPDRLIKLDEVKRIVGLAKTMIYQLVNAKKFPKPCKLGVHASRWSEREIYMWVAEQIAARPAIH